jgi:hypothetical protein
VTTATVTHAKIELLEAVFSVRSAAKATALYNIATARDVFFAVRFEVTYNEIYLDIEKSLLQNMAHWPTL